MNDHERLDVLRCLARDRAATPAEKATPAASKASRSGSASGGAGGPAQAQGCGPGTAGRTLAAHLG